LASDFADEVLGGRYEYVLTTHIDKGRVHNRLMFCAASFVDRKKYVSIRRSYAAIDTTIVQSKNFEDFLRCMEDVGYEAKGRGIEL
jgi:hypothetical protein